MTQINIKLTLLKSLLIIQFISLVIYSSFAVKNEGLTLFQIFINNVTSINWNGQFNLDFTCYLILSGIWTMWRNKFSFFSIIIAINAMIIGIMFFAPYLLYLLIVEKGDINKVLIGK